MKRINIVSVKMVRDSSKCYDCEKQITTPQAAKDAINALFSLEDEDREVFGVLALDTKNTINGAHIVSIGTLNSNLVHPREVFKIAVLNNAASIMLFHNHPSGNPAPSREDENITNRLCDAGKIMGIEVLDHIIIGYNKFISFREKGLITR